MPTAPPRACPHCRKSSAGRCPCRQSVTHLIDVARGTAAQRGYGRRHRFHFRIPVLRRDPYCRCTDATCRAHRDRSHCTAYATVADHWPLTRRELVERRLDPDDPQHGRGLCKGCHDHATGTDRRTRGGWNKQHYAT